jgi:hypothetical protein
MKNPLNHITNYFTLKKLAKPCPTSGGYDMERLIEAVQRIYKKKNSMMRNLAAKAVKFQRIETPFVPIDYSEAKEMYDSYFQMENHIPSKEHFQERIEKEGIVYFVKFRNEIPVKGDSYASYYINWTHGDNQIGKLTKDNFDSFYNWDALTAYRYATTEEIEMYEEIERKIESLDEIREKSNQESLNASNEINDLRKLRNSQIK